MTKSVLLIGGSGFIGRQIAAKLAQLGYRITIPTRNREAVKTDLLVLPGCEIVNANIHQPDVLDRLCKSQDVVINLVGILQGSLADFERSHILLTEKIIAACKTHQVRRYLHMSALGADVNGPSMYQRTKGQAEEKVRASGLDWTIFRPSVVFGAQDSFLNLFASLLKIAPLVPIGGAQTRFQPVWVGDVAQAFAVAVDRTELIGQTLSLVGPHVYTLAELVKYTGQVSGHERCVIGLPNWAARLQATAMSILPKPPVSHDNLDSLKVDNIDPTGFAAILGWQATALEAIVPTYLANQHQASQLDACRSKAGRSH
ncbi:complex I NDUFA9 subunit family protein [Chitinibacter bivalviorum]|uniref:Complex I NDUFA9 subunit family protein n=1 Tax=Chitinibacter bivalviorum TaxID=2739434 RepID=A0A7H9BLW6_9NEIS|nr:complex I NDUFA9 subunit family protein [Chitinibacter bivalviorum]QLG89605.1 complex I NDUFA9 subunit family protein [Chitinibacter bivalviorum]